VGAKIIKNLLEPQTRFKIEKDFSPGDFFKESLLKIERLKSLKYNAYQPHIFAWDLKENLVNGIINIQA